MSAGSDAVVAATLAWLGTPYRHQGSVRGAGCDCLGLVRGVWRTLYGSEPWTVPPYRPGWRHTTGGLEAAARRWLVPVEAPAPGCILLFRLVRTRPPRHCAILVGEGRFVHAQEGLGVVAADLTEGWRRRVAGVFGFPDRTI